MGFTYKQRALAKHLNVKPGEVEESQYSNDVYEAESEEWLVLTDDEADEKTKQQIREILWAFNYNFLRAHFRKGIEDSNELEKSVTEMQSKLCEGANEIVFGMIEDFDYFAEDAINTDGRGHFLSGYDGNEEEVVIRDKYFFLYRQN